MALRFSKLTRPAIRSLKPGEKIEKHTITAQRLSNGDVRYTVNPMVDGRRYHRVVGNESAGVTRQQAEDFIASLRTKARDERLDLPAGRKLAMSFSEAVERYLEHLEQIGGKNLPIKQRHLRGRLKDHFGGMRADRVSTSDVERFCEVRRLAGSSDATINRELSSLSHMFRTCEDLGWIKPGSRPKTRKRAERPKKIVVLGMEQSEALMRAAINDADDRLSLFVAIGLNTAMRHGEILRIHLDDVDFSSNRLFIGKAKAGAREQPIIASLRTLLEQEREFAAKHGGWYFPSRNADAKKPHRLYISKSFRRAVKAAGLCPDQVTPHVMRHTAITRLVKAKADVPTIQKISGQKTYTMVLRYTHIHGDHIDAAIAAIDQPLPVRITPKLHTADGSQTP